MLFCQRNREKGLSGDRFQLPREQPTSELDRFDSSHEVLLSTVNSKHLSSLAKCELRHFYDANRQ